MKRTKQTGTSYNWEKVWSCELDDRFTEKETIRKQSIDNNSHTESFYHRMELRKFGYCCPASDRKYLFGLSPDSQIRKAPSCCLKRVACPGIVHQNNHDGQDTPCLKQEKIRTHFNQHIICVKSYMYVHQRLRKHWHKQYFLLFNFFDVPWRAS